MRLRNGEVGGLGGTGASSAMQAAGHRHIACEGMAGLTLELLRCECDLTGGEAWRKRGVGWGGGVV